MGYYLSRAQKPLRIERGPDEEVDWGKMDGVENKYTSMPGFFVSCGDFQNKKCKLQPAHY